MKVLLVVVCLMTLVGCAIQSEDIDWAKEKCATNGGIKSMTKDLAVTVVNCNNGMGAHK